jgi:hypothetical protein
MGLLANLKVRKKLLVVLAPLALMVLLASSYASFESKRIDTWYSSLIDNELEAAHHIDAARALMMRYGLLLYRLVVETNRDRTQAMNSELDNTYAEYKVHVADAMRLYPAFARQITSASTTFENAVLVSRPVRDAALAGDRPKAVDLLHSLADAELEQSRLKAIAISDEMRKAVDQRSDDLTARTHRSITITWLVLGVGMIVSLVIASYFIQVDVVRELWTVRLLLPR